jgi:cytoskeletal protein CcmA (bactofilin family)
MGIGQTIVIKGEVSGEEDLLIAGRIEGHVRLNGCTLTLAPGSQIVGDVHAGTVVAAGHLEGRVLAANRLEVHATAALEGELTTPALHIADGAQVHGRVEMPARPRRDARPLDSARASASHVESLAAVV